MPKTKTKAKRKTKQPKLTPMEEYRQKVNEILKDFLPRLEEVDKEIRFLKCLYFVKEYKSGTRIRKWLYSLKPKDRLNVINNMVGPFFDNQTVMGRNPGDQVLRERTLKLLGCPALQ